MESVADWYSRNLATETTKGKRERAMQGYHNNIAPFGMDKREDGVLIPNEKELVGLRLGFELYVTGEYSDNTIAHILNEKGYQSKTGRPFSTDTVRDMLQNRTYLGFTKYQQYKRHSDGRCSWEAPVEWFKGKHDAVIDEELFECCQKIRYAKAIHHEYYPKHRVYLLRDLIYCADCVANMSESVDDPAYGKIRPQSHTNGQYLLYRCRAKDFGRTCSQGSVKAQIIDDQIIAILKTLKPPADWQERIVKSMSQLLGDQKLDERITEIKAIIERMDFRWDNGFITDYLEKRVQFQQELEQPTPIADDDLAIAKDLLENFAAHWDATGGDREAQYRLIQLIVSRVWVRGNKVVAVSLRPNCHVTMGLESTKSTEMTVDFSGTEFVHRRERREFLAHWVLCLVA